MSIILLYLNPTRGEMERPQAKAFHESRSVQILNVAQYLRTLQKAPQNKAVSKLRPSDLSNVPSSTVLSPQFPPTKHPRNWARHRLLCPKGTST